MIPAVERARRRVVPDLATGCHIFTGALSEGYGVVGAGPRGTGTVFVHRLMYEAAHGPIPAGLHIDHLCRNRACCNPEHLEAVTQAENNRRAADARDLSTCRRGHPWTPESTYTSPKRGNRTCLICREIRRNERKASR